MTKRLHDLLQNVSHATHGTVSRTGAGEVAHTIIMREPEDLRERFRLTLAVAEVVVASIADVQEALGGGPHLDQVIAWLQGAAPRGTIIEPRSLSDEIVLWRDQHAMQAAERIRQGGVV